MNTQLTFGGCPACGSTDPRACCAAVREEAMLRKFSGSPTSVSTPPLPDPAENRIGKFHGPASGAPETQRGAAMRVYPRTGTARARVLAKILAAGEYGVIDEDGYAALRMIQNTYIPRRNELMHGGWIEDSGRRRTTRAGAEAVVWVATEAARRQRFPYRTEDA